MRVLSQCSTGLGRHDRRNAAARGGKIALTVYSYNQAAAITGLARRTLERLIALGEGPAIIELSPRRRGILESDLIGWLHKRRRAGAAIANLSMKDSH
jgi:predicted DNA-binding transcriptional regulator AlpA